MVGGLSQRSVPGTALTWIVDLEDSSSGGALIGISCISRRWSCSAARLEPDHRLPRTMSPAPRAVGIPKIMSIDNVLFIGSHHFKQTRYDFHSRNANYPERELSPMDYHQGLFHITLILPSCIDMWELIT